MAKPQRVDHETVFLLHATPWRESSLWLEVYSRNHGRVALLARSARKRQSELRGVIVPFVPFSASWFGDNELKTLHRAEWLGGWQTPQGQNQFAAWYINELLLKLTAREDPNPALFDALSQIMQTIGKQQNYIAPLRQFERTLLLELGLAHDFTQDADGMAIDANADYWVQAEHVPVLFDKLQYEPAKGLKVRGKTLLAMANNDWQDGEVLAEALQLNRLFLDFYLPEGIKTRQVLQQLNALKQQFS
ncbi:MAG: DNA repair protein RecO [Neisseria sp.]|nr:DNA repair protein RecO [Neisseria sp.]